MTEAPPAMPVPSVDDAALAVALVTGAGRVLQGLREEVDAAGGRFVARELKNAADAASQAWLAAALANARPQDAVLSEEATDDPARLDADRVWIIDPLDGTREFAERHGDGPSAGLWRDDFAVHVALWERGRGLTVGAVGLPARGRVYSTAAARNGGEDGVKHRRVLQDGGRPVRLAASRTRPPAFVRELADRGDAELVPMGSAGVKVVSVVEGVVDAYVHGGGQFEWDSAAPVAVARSAGLVCSRLDGAPLEYNREDPWLPDLFVCHPDVTPRLRAALEAVGIESKEGAQP